MATPEQFLFEFLADEDDLINGLRRTEQQLKRATRGKYRFNVEGSGFRQVIREADSVEKKLRELAEETAEPEVRMLIAKALGDIATVRSAMAALPENKDISVELKLKGLSTLARAERASERLGTNLDRIQRLGRGESLAPDPSSWDHFTAALSRAALQIRRLPSFIGGLSIALVATLLPAILAVSLALVGAATSVGVFATALVASLIPAIGVAVSLFNRLSKVMEARQGLEQARRSDAARAASAVDTEAAAENRLEGAARAVADAQRSQQRASEDLQDATEALAQASEDAFREMAQAAEDASDAFRSLEGAKLGLDEARLGVDEANLALEQFREGIGLTGDEFQTMFKKFTDVDFQFDKGALEKILGDSDASKEDSLELESLILRVRRAKLQEREATDGVSDAERDLADARRRNNEFLRNGILASDSYRAALDRVTAAEQAVDDATRAANRAREDAADTARDVATAAGGMSSALAAAQADFDRLSPAEKRFALALERVDGAVENLKKNIAAPIFDAFTDGLNALPAVLAKVRLPLLLLANAWANLGKQFATDATKAVTDNFTALASGAIGLSAEFTRIFTSIFRSIINLAVAAMPQLLDVISDVADTFASWEKGTRNAKGIQDAIEPGIESLRIFAGLIVDTGRALFGAFQGASEPINEFLQFIGDGIKSLADWFNSAHGRNEVKEFFKDTLPFVKSLIKFLAVMVKIFLRLLRIVLPILKPIVDMFTLLAEVLNFFLGIIDDIISPIKSLIGEVLSLFAVVGLLGKITKGATLLFANFGKVMTKVGEFFGGIFTPLVDSARVAIAWIRSSPSKFAGALRAVGRAISSVWGRIADVFRRPVRAGLDWIRGALNSAKGWVGGAVRGVVSVFDKAWRGIRVVITWIVDRFRALRDRVIAIFKGLGEGIAAGFRGVKDTIKAILNVLIGIANKFINAWNAVFGKQRKIKGPGPLPDITLPGLKLGNIPKLALGGIVGKDTLFRAGEGSGSEAVVPLSRSVLRKLGQAIVKAMGSGSILGSGGPALAAGGGFRLNTGTAPMEPRLVIERQDVHLPAPPAGGVLDPRYAAAQFAREIKRRGF